MSTPPESTSVTTESLVTLIGSQTVTIARQAALLTSQAARIAELEDATASSRVTTTAFKTS
jgi:hypothetical protein